MIDDDDDDGDNGDDGDDDCDDDGGGGGGGDDDDDDDDDGIPRRLALCDGSLYFSFRLPHTWPDVEEHMFVMSVIVTNGIGRF